jgi:hypothetical protein
VNLIREQDITKEKLLFGFEPFVKVGIEVSQLPLEHQIAFFASCCDRLLPIYSLASNQPGWGDIWNNYIRFFRRDSSSLCVRAIAHIADNEKAIAFNLTNGLVLTAGAVRVLRGLSFAL